MNEGKVWILLRGWGMKWGYAPTDLPVGTDLNIIDIPVYEEAARMRINPDEEHEFSAFQGTWEEVQAEVDKKNEVLREWLIYQVDVGKSDWKYTAILPMERRTKEYQKGLDYIVKMQNQKFFGTKEEVKQEVAERNEKMEASKQKPPSSTAFKFIFMNPHPNLTGWIMYERCSKEWKLMGTGGTKVENVLAKLAEQLENS